MDWFTGSIVYLLTWWVVLFAVLPWGVRQEENPAEGHEPGAPRNADIPRKFLITTGISAVIWVILFLLIDQGVINFRQMAGDMPL